MVQMAKANGVKWYGHVLRTDVPLFPGLFKAITDSLFFFLQFVNELILFQVFFK